MSAYREYLVDFKANRKNPKGRLVLLMFRLASMASRSNKLVKLLMLPYLIFYRIFVEWILGIELPWRVEIGPGLRVFHGVGLVINDQAVIGARCVLRHSTTIGVAGTSETFDGAAPIIGDDVDIGAHVVVIGGIRIGSGSVIGAGSVVTKDVPDNSLVVGNPARIIRSL
jgi:putative colanic acid biosynthesis acetyltransferase WcaB